MPVPVRRLPDGSLVSANPEYKEDLITRADALAKAGQFTKAQDLIRRASKAPKRPKNAPNKSWADGWFNWLFAKSDKTSSLTMEPESKPTASVSKYAPIETPATYYSTVAWQTPIQEPFYAPSALPVNIPQPLALPSAPIASPAATVNIPSFPSAPAPPAATPPATQKSTTDFMDATVEAMRAKDGRYGYKPQTPINSSSVPFVTSGMSFPAPSSKCLGCGIPIPPGGLYCAVCQAKVMTTSNKNPLPIIITPTIAPTPTPDPSIITAKPPAMPPVMPQAPIAPSPSATPPSPPSPGPTLKGFGIYSRKPRRQLGYLRGKD